MFEHLFKWDEDAHPRGEGGRWIAVTFSEGKHEYGVRRQVQEDHGKFFKTRDVTGSHPAGREEFASRSRAVARANQLNREEILALKPRPPKGNSVMLNKFDSILKAGNSEGARRAWESRRGTSEEDYKRHNLDQINNLAVDIKNKVPHDIAMGRYNASTLRHPNWEKSGQAFVPPGQEENYEKGNAAIPSGHKMVYDKNTGEYTSKPKGFFAKVKDKFRKAESPLGGLFRRYKAEADYHERALRAWESRRRGDGETARAGRAFVAGKPYKPQPKVHELQAEIDKLKGQLKAALAAQGGDLGGGGKVVPAIGPKGKQPALGPTQQKSLHDYFKGGGPRDPNERAYYLARAEQIVKGIPRPSGMSGKFGVDRMRVGKVEGMLYFIQKGWRKKNGV